MLSLQTKTEIREAFPDVYWAPMSYPDYPDLSEWGYRPQVRWPFEGHDEPDPPYEQITLRCSPAGVVESDQPTDERFAVSEVAGVDADAADVETVKGRLVYDVLNLKVVAEGSETLRGVQLNANQRAHQLTRALHGWILDVFPSRPLDQFDDEGAPVPDDPEQVFADELSPPLRVDPIAGRGPTDVTGQTDDDPADAQHDAAVELHYVDAHPEYSYGAADAPGGLDLTVNVDLGSEPDAPADPLAR